MLQPRRPSLRLGRTKPPCPFAAASLGSGLLLLLHTFTVPAPHHLAPLPDPAWPSINDLYSTTNYTPCCLPSCSNLKYCILHYFHSLPTRMYGPQMRLLSHCWFEEQCQPRNGCPTNALSELQGCTPWGRFHSDAQPSSRDSHPGTPPLSLASGAGCMTMTFDT